MSGDSFEGLRACKVSSIMCSIVLCSCPSPLKTPGRSIDSVKEMCLCWRFEGGVPLEQLHRSMEKALLEGDERCSTNRKQLKRSRMCLRRSQTQEHPSQLHRSAAARD
ncbi:hypothetical protein WMY93_023605 [Mugilogobius chulae]|uniref:Uncharacterized protein n=1 Tax=Mugilogobius chulae TaxID=88201 RepID=A0AAW0N964_9GOBI